MIGLMVVVVVVASRSESCQKIEELSKSLKSLNGLKKVQSLLVWKNVYQAPILCQLDTNNSIFR